MNLGLSEVLKTALPNTISIIRPLVPKAKYLITSNWPDLLLVRDFFFIKVNKSRNKAGVGVQLVFQVFQHIRDQELLKSFVSYFNCGQYINSLQKE